MKKIFKGLSTVALSLMLGLNVTNVSAETVSSCPAGTTEHTNYYLFINENSASYYNDHLTETNINFGTYNQTWKWNNIKTNVVMRGYGQIPIVRNGETTGGSNLSSWTVQQYWNAFKKTVDNMDSESAMYTEGNTSYILHTEYIKYDTADYVNGISIKDAALKDGLKRIAKLVETNLTELSTDGTNLPATDIAAPDAVINGSVDTRVLWKATREYRYKDRATGIATAGTQMVYSPAVYMLKFCDAGSSDSNTVTLTYDSNTTDSVTGMPTPTTVTKDKTACEKINSARPVRTGYTFVGWSTTKGENNTADSNFAPGSGQYCESTNLTLYAVWSKNGGTPNPSGSYKVYYDANGGKDAPKTDESTNNSCVTISSQKPVQSGNNFLGWSREKGAREADPKYAAGKEYCGEEGDITLYAVWGTQTGISAHLIAFAAVAMGAGAALIVAKKKNLFKQI